MRICVLSLVLLAAGVGCGDTEEGQGDPVASFRADSGLTFEDCADLALSHDTTCTEAYRTSATCFSDALAACTPAHLREEFPTTEGDPIIYDFFVVPEGAGCSVVWFTDNRADAFSRDEDRVVSRQDCEGFAGLPPLESDVESCRLLVGESCSAAEVVGR